MKNKEIIIEVDPKGNVNLEAIGFKGGTCEAALEPIEQAIGEVASRKRKPEFYQKEKVGVKHGAGK